MRALLAALGMLLPFFAVLPQAQAEDEAATRRVVIVLDRGEAAKATRRTDENNALRVWTSLSQRGIEVSLVAAGVDGDDETQLTAVPPTKAGIAGLARRPAFDFSGPTDPRAALAHALAGGVAGPIDVLLLGPFGPVAGSEGEGEADARVAAWNDKAPEGSRVLAVRASEDARDALVDARGVASDGRIVVGFGEPRVETQPFSPFGAGPEGISARIRILADVVMLGAKADHTAVLAASSDAKDDTIQVEAIAGLHTLVLRRRPDDGRTATLTFAPVANRRSTQWLVEPPGPLTFRWEELAKEARLEGPDGKPAAPFVAVDVEVGAPKEVVLRLRRTRKGPPPAWRVAAKDGDLPLGLSATVGSEVETSPEIGESEVRVRFVAAAGRPIDARGTLLLEAEGYETPVALPFEIRVQKGAARLLVEGASAAAFPRAETEERPIIGFEALNANAPKALQVRAACDGGQEQWLRGLVLSEGGSVARWDPTKPLLLDVGVKRSLAFELAEDAPAELLWPCKVTLRADAIEGVGIDGGGVITVRKRRPHIKLGGPPPAFTLENGVLVSAEPLVLQLDPDGGDGAFLLDLFKTPPMLRSRGGSTGWQTVPRGQGIWHVVPTGEWSGTQPTIFRDQEEHVEIEIRWERGRTPGTITVPVEIGARWGKRGFVLVSLALMALLLALLIVGYMRTPPVKGVLLYTVDGLDGTVGRLDLAPVRRKTRVIVSDDKGKLSIAPKGDAIAKIRPTRVGGMLEYIDPHGTKEKRLLVDGVSLRLGRHLVRFVYGRPEGDEPAPTAPAGDDLLGPEYDIESGKIEALEDDPTDA